MLTLAEWAKLITEEKGRLRALAMLAALSDPFRGWMLLRFMTFMSKSGSSYMANWASASAAAATRAINAEFTDVAPVPNEYQFLMRAAGGDMKLDRNQMNDGNNSAVIRAGLLTQKLIDTGARLNRLWFAGDKANADEWHGANEFCDDVDQVIEAGANGEELTAAMMDDLLDMVPGANFILCNTALARKATNLEVGVQRTIELNSGLDRPDFFRHQYKGIPIIAIRTAPNDGTGVQEEILPQTEVLGTSGATCSRITAVRLGVDGVHGIEREPMRMDDPVLRGAFEYNHMNWFMSGLATDDPAAIGQLIGVQLS